MRQYTGFKYRINETELSNYICKLRSNKTDFTIKWSILKDAAIILAEEKDGIHV